MRILVTIFGILVIIGSCISATSDEFDNYKYREYCKIAPTQINIEREIGGNELLELIADSDAIDTNERNYYLASATVENKTAIDGYFWSYSAFAEGEYGYSCGARPTAQTKREQEITDGWYVPAGQSITIHFILDTPNDAQTVQSRADEEVMATLPTDINNG